MINIEEQEEPIIPYFRKTPIYGSQIFRCEKCLNERIYGFSPTMPDNRKVIIQCEGSCNGNTLHVYIRTHLGREERKYF